MDDPLTLALAPPPGETQEQAEARIRAERAALKISDDIDRELRLELQAARRHKCVKVLLLGQSESGKSTVLKNFQRRYDPLAFDRERAVWRLVCQLNVVRSFGIILDVLNHVFDAQDRHQQSDPLTPPTSPRVDPEHDRTANPAATATSQKGSKLTPEHRRLTMRLAPLRQIEHALTRRLRSCSYAPITPPHSPLSRSRSNQELYLSGYAWQRVREHRSGADPCTQDGDEDEGMNRVLCACQDDMVTLWNDPFVRKLLKVQRVGMEELSRSFLDSLARIAVPNYEPTDDDILRARIKTLGVTEHRFTIRPKAISTADFRIYDVGGSVGLQFPTWMPFFDDVNAIVFLAPMSAFDQTLVEAPEVNRLEDTFGLWKSICSSKLLVSVSLVLLLNKRDILQRKLESGIRFGRYVKSYTGKNQWEAVAKYLRTKFKAVQRELSPVRRMFYAHVTCATVRGEFVTILSRVFLFYAYAGR
ncbi:guanine nucleotide binding protein, alpha subunit [Gautieria morchelliformis]|nr:guanine nucleotide binding protein, alpha subunit [Gautieria morchelliformis]